MTYNATRRLGDMEAVYYDLIEPAAELTDSFVLDLIGTLRKTVKTVVPSKRRSELRYGTASRFTRGSRVTRMIQGKYDLDFPDATVLHMRMEDHHDDKGPFNEQTLRHTSFHFEHLTTTPGGQFPDLTFSELGGFGHAAAMPQSGLRYIRPYTSTGVGIPYRDDLDPSRYEDPGALAGEFTQAYMDRIIGSVELGRLVTGIAALEGVKDACEPITLAAEPVHAWRTIDPDTVNATWTPYIAQWISASI